MAKLDIDRHILTEIAKNNNEIAKLTHKITKMMSKAGELAAKNEALSKHLVNVVEEFDTGKGLESHADLPE